MTTYSIKAPNGRVYEIDGPPGATDEQVRSQVLAQHPDAEKPSAIRLAQDAEDAKIRAQGGASGNPVMDFFAGSGKALTDIGLGARQLAASAGLGDKEALAKEAAAKEKTDTSLMNTGAGVVGKFGTDIGLSMLPMGALTKVANARMLPGATNFVARLARATAPSTVIGAGEGVLAPDENYAPASAAAKGAAWGAGGDLAGRVVGRVISPTRFKASRGTREWVDELTNAKMLPQPTAVNLLENEGVKQASDALSKIPVFGSSLNKAQAANRAAVTEYATGRAGLPMTDTHDFGKIGEALSDEAKAFRSGPRISTGRMPAELMPIHAEAASAVASGAGSRSVLNRTDTALRDATQTPSYSPNTLMDLRQKMSDLAYGATGVDRDKFQRLQKVYEDALRKAHGADKFDAWKKKWGAYEDVKRTVEKGGTDSAEALMPAAFQKEVANTATGAPGTHPRLVRAAAARIPQPPGQENRALLTALMLGGLGAGGIAGGTTADPGDAFLDTLKGVGYVGLAGLGSGKLLGSKGGAEILMGQKKWQSQAARDRLRQLLASGAMNVGGSE